MTTNNQPLERDDGAARRARRERKRWHRTLDTAALLDRRDFVAATRFGVKQARPGIVLQARPNGRRENAIRCDMTACDNAAGETNDDELLAQRRPHCQPSIRVGLTASRKVGNAVARNRAKRRLRALARDILSNEAAPAHDYVLIARGATVDRPFSRLAADLRGCLKKLGLQRSSRQSVTTHADSSDRDRTMRKNWGP